MDKTIRALERKAAVGDINAQQQLERARERSGLAEIKPFAGPFEDWKYYRVIKSGARLGSRRSGPGVKLKIGDVVRYAGTESNGAWNPSSLTFSVNGEGRYNFRPGSWVGVPETGYLEPVED